MAERPKAAVLKTVFGFPSRLSDYICLGARRSSPSGIGVSRCAYCVAKIGCWKAAHQPAPKERDCPPRDDASYDDGYGSESHFPGLARCSPAGGSESSLRYRLLECH